MTLSPITFACLSVYGVQPKNDVNACIYKSRMTMGTIECGTDFGVWIEAKIDSALKLKRASIMEECSVVGAPEAIRQEYQDCVREILDDHGYCNTWLCMDLLKMANRHEQYFVNLPNLIRDKLIMYYIEGRFGGESPSIKVLSLHKGVCTRKLPPGLAVNPLAVNSGMFVIDDVHQDILNKCERYMATVEIQGGAGVTRSEEVEVLLLLSFPSWRSVIMQAIEDFIVVPLRNRMEFEIDKKRQLYEDMYHRDQTGQTG